MRNLNSNLVALIALNVALIHAAIGSRESHAQTADDTGSQRFATEGKGSGVTFAEHIAPIIFNNCTSCHRPGEAAPFTLMNYQEVKKRAKQIAEVAEKKIMPPWHAEKGHGEFINERLLSPDQIQVLRLWVQNGTASGDLAKVPALPHFTEGWQLGEPDLVVKMPEPYEVNADGPDIYRNFVLPLNLSEEKFVQAIEFRPSARSIVHHCLFFIDDSGAARQLDQADPGPGYNGMGRGAREFSGVGGWAVGSNPRKLPQGLAWRVPKGSDLVLQTHFHPSGKAEREQSLLGLYFAKAPPQKSFVGVQLPPLFGALAGIDIPAGASNYVVKDSFTLPIDVEAFAVSGHAHYLAKEMKLTAILPDGRAEGMLWIRDWDFGWQEQYAYKRFVPLPKGIRLDVSICYDNSENNPRNPSHPPQRVRWGRMSFDEMGSITLQVVASREEEMAQLRSALNQHTQAATFSRLANRNKSKSRGGGENKTPVDKHVDNPPDAGSAAEPVAVTSGKP